MNDTENVFLKTGIIDTLIIYLTHQHYLHDVYLCHLSFCSCNFRSRVIKIFFLFVALQAKKFILVRMYSCGCLQASPQKKSVKNLQMWTAFLTRFWLVFSYWKKNSIRCLFDKALFKYIIILKLSRHNTET